jgi:hypothetical protein
MLNSLLRDKTDLVGHCTLWFVAVQGGWAVRTISSPSGHFGGAETYL